MVQWVHDWDGSCWLVQIGVGVGGMNILMVLGVIDARLVVFFGWYVVLVYGTNDHLSEF